MRRPIGLRATVAAVVVMSLVPLADAGSVASEVGLDALIARLGAGNVPTGAGVVVAQVEAPISPGNYGPDQNHPEFSGKTFFPQSGSPGNSSHATTVATNLYGAVTSIAPGIDEIYLWEANAWATSGYLNTFSGGTRPASPPAGLVLFNHSWVGDFGPASTNNDALRRADFAMVRDNLLMIVGVNNSAPNEPLMSHVFNGLSVGLMSGGHVSDATLAGLDGPGRMKPEIVAPNSLTSFATPVVSAAVALMVETARTDPDLWANPNALRGEVIKAVLMAGATHRAGWTNNPATSGPARGTTSQPLDAVYGVDLVNVDTSHLILTAGEQEGDLAPPAAVNAGHVGWDLAGLGPDESRYWRFSVNNPATEVSVLATWHRKTSGDFSASFEEDFDLTWWRVDGQGNLTTLVGDPGLPFFTGGNVVSESRVDNVEHLYLTGLQPGDYVLELRRFSNEPTFTIWDAAVAWVLPPCPSDINGDGFVNVLDLIRLLLCFGQPAVPGCEAEDLNGDGSVNVLDLIELLLDFGQICVAVTRPQNDDCADRVAILDGLTSQETIFATTDGLATSGLGDCGAFGDTQIYKDVWYNYTATCSGTLTVSTCNDGNPNTGEASFDTKIAIYEGCDALGCPFGGTEIGCADDAPGCAGFSTVVTAPVKAGNCYKIRLGGFTPADVGSVIVSVGCAP